MFLPRHLGLDFWICIVDDRQEHIQKNKEDEENVENEVSRAKDAVRLLQLGKLEIAEKNAELWKPVKNKVTVLCSNKLLTQQNAISDKQVHCTQTVT